MGIDAPEKKQPFGQVSKQHLSSLVFGKTVDVEWFKKDRYQRTLGKILLDGLDVNREQIKSGMAWHYKKYEKEQLPEDRQSYADSETAAQQRRVGLWGDANPVPPWDFRHK
jgi:endonuclease YncB( thermonuclease family)